MNAVFGRKPFGKRVLVKFDSAKVWMRKVAKPKLVHAGHELADGWKAAQPQLRKAKRDAGKGWRKARPKLVKARRAAVLGWHKAQPKLGKAAGEVGAGMRRGWAHWRQAV